MVLESIIRPAWIDKNPFYAFFLGITLAFIGTSIGLFIFPEQASFAGLMFITIAAIPYLQKVIDFEEIKKGVWHEDFWKRNRKIAIIYALFFFGVAIAYFIWFKVIPLTSAQFFFNRQITALTHPTTLGFFAQAQLNQFIPIVMNNLKVLFLVMILSLIYGMGSVLIITWNASVLGVFIGSFGKFTDAIGFFPHASMEFLGFFFGAMAGSLISMAFDEDRTEFKSDRFYRAINDAALLFILAVVIIIAAALVEIRLF
jgi:uncharacterized membrane protein SpoIIM required for sporulation